MKPKTTRTLNPLPFQDLEPHRFEDLIRQLAYDLRRWKSLEAIGRTGSDEGIDIRGIELIRIDDEVEDFDEGETIFEERLWIFQCKREKAFGPQKAINAVKESLASLVKPPYGLILAVSTDISKKTRDAFREEMVAQGIEEFAIWAKGELEDMLFQPKNDRLLFAYFGLSLQPKRRSLITTLRSQIARKKELTKLFDEKNPRDQLVLLRDPTDKRYPKEPTKGEPPAKWLACHAIDMKSPGQLLVLWREHLACTTPDCKGWDAIFDFDENEDHVKSDLRSEQALSVDKESVRFEYGPPDFWHEYIHKQDQAYLKIYRGVPIDRILAIDPIGDGYFPIPHILIQFNDKNGPFSSKKVHDLQRLSANGGNIEIQPTKENRIKIFPEPLPGAQEPPPANFDDTSEEIEPLSEDIKDKFEGLLSKLNKQSESRTGDIGASDDSAKSWLVEKNSFMKWRDKTAMPLFSAFVKALRESGHTARVVLRSVEHEPPKSKGFESIMIRIQLHMKSIFSSSYGISGHFGISISEDNGWRKDVFPTPERTDNPYKSSIPIKNQKEISKQELENQILAVLERLKTYIC